MKLLVIIIGVFAVGIFGTLIVFQNKNASDTEEAKEAYENIYSPLENKKELDYKEFVKTAYVHKNKSKNKPVLKQPHIMKFLDGEYNFSMGGFRDFSNPNRQKFNFNVWRSIYKGADKKTISDEALKSKILSRFDSWATSMAEIEDVDFGLSGATHFGHDEARKLKKTKKVDLYKKVTSLASVYDDFARIQIMCDETTEAIYPSEVMFFLMNLYSKDVVERSEYTGLISLNTKFCTLVNTIARSEGTALNDISFLQGKLMDKSIDSVLARVIHGHRINIFKLLETHTGNLLQTESDNLSVTGSEFAMTEKVRYQVLITFLEATNAALYDSSGNKLKYFDFKSIAKAQKIVDERTLQYGFDITAKEVIDKAIESFINEVYYIGAAKIARHLSAIALACENYRIENKTWPKELKDLQPKYLSKKLENPFTGEEYTYALPVKPKKQEEGQPKVVVDKFPKISTMLGAKELDLKRFTFSSAKISF